MCVCVSFTFRCFRFFVSRLFFFFFVQILACEIYIWFSFSHQIVCLYVRVPCQYNCYFLRLCLFISFDRRLWHMSACVCAFFLSSILRKTLTAALLAHRFTMVSPIPCYCASLSVRSKDRFAVEGKTTKKKNHGIVCSHAWLNVKLFICSYEIDRWSHETVIYCSTISRT